VSIGMVGIESSKRQEKKKAWRIYAEYRRFVGQKRMDGRWSRRGKIEEAERW